MSVGVPPTFDKAIVCDPVVATKEYHTSSFGRPAPLSGTPESVADCKVPEVFTPQAKSALTVKAIAPLQLSFAGGPGKVPTQRSKVVVFVIAAAATLKTLT
ncbi:hypothetical protein D3C86_1473170 [compost metagenome]